MFSELQLKQLAGINIGMSAFSFLGSSFIVANYIGFKSMRKFALKLVTCMAICDMITSLGRFVGSPESGVACYIQAYLMSFGSLASMLWTGSIAFTIHQIFLKHNMGVTSHLRRYHIFVWTLTIILVLLPQVTDSYGDAGAWCWIENNSLGKVWRWVQFYIPLWILIIYISYVYVRIIRSERQHRKRQHQTPTTEQAVTTAVSRMKFYPLILLIAYFWATVNRIHELFSPEPLFWLTCLHVLFDSIQGMLNAIVYGMTPSVMRQDKAFLVAQFQKCGFCLDQRAEFVDVSPKCETDDDPVEDLQKPTNEEDRLTAIVTEDTSEIEIGENINGQLECGSHSETGHLNSNSDQIELETGIGKGDLDKNLSGMSLSE